MFKRMIAAGLVSVALAATGVMVAAAPAEAVYLECSKTVISTIKTVTVPKTQGGVNSYYCDQLQAVVTLSVPPNSLPAKLRGKLSNQSGTTIWDSGWQDPKACPSPTSGWRSGKCFTAYGIADLPAGGTEDIIANTGQVCR